MAVKLRRALLILLCFVFCTLLSPAVFAEEAGAAPSPVTVIFYCDDDSALPYLSVTDEAGNEYAPVTNSDTGEVKYGQFRLLPGEYRYAFHDEAGRYEDTAGSLTVEEVYIRFHYIELTPIIELQSFSFNYVNPIYADVITEDDFPEPAISEEELEAEAYSLAKRYSGGNRRKAVFYSDSGTLYSADNYALAGNELKQQILNRETTAIIRVEYNGKISTKPEFKSLTDTIFGFAIAHSPDAPTHGDYIRYEYGGYNASGDISYVASTNITTCVIAYTPVYYTTAAQESQLNTKAASILSGLALSGKSDYQKVRAIYDYLCAHVSYDHANEDNDEYKLKFTAYAALVNNTAVCQGFSCAFYRLCLAAGVDTRIITSSQMVHAWNIARVNGVYYELDATWDADKKNPPGAYKYLLKSDSYWLSNHKHNGISVLGDQFNNSSFAAAYPLSTTNFEDLSAVPVDSSPAALKSSITGLADILAGQTKLMANGANDIERFLVSVSARAANGAAGTSVYDAAVSVAACNGGSMLAETLLDQTQLSGGATYSFSLSVPAAWAGKKLSYTRSGWGAANESGTLTASAGASPTVSFSSLAHLGRFVLEPVKYSVSFNVNGGSAVAAQSIVNGDKAAKPADPTKDGSWFVAWYTDSACTTEFSFDTPITADTTVYAKWVTPDFVLPSALTDIEAGAFEGGAFSFPLLPEGTESIGYRAFADCENLKYIYIPANTVIDLGAFEGVTEFTIFGRSPSGEFYMFYPGYIMCES